ncbi:hypothetical protein BH23GEM11_BH23GEM11_15850 [soil metagenome]
MTSTSPESPRDLTGTVLANRYKIIKRLGVGAMGEVYLGEHLRMGRRDAIKVLRSGMAREPEAMARFTRGARNVSRIRHPNVCQVYDFGEAEDGVLFLAMEFVDGGSLGDVLAEGPLDLEPAARLLHQASEALHAAHEQGIIHRDLKPDNMMRARTPEGPGQIKVVDFDIARGPADEEGAGVTRHGFVVGTPEYMSPEQLTGDALDRRSDVYSLALVMVRMITGKLPFEGTTAQDIMLQRLTVEPTSVSALAPPGTVIPEALDRAIARALARRPDDRTPDSRTLAREVMEAVRPAKGQVASRSGSAPQPVAPSSRPAKGGLGLPVPETQVAPATAPGAAPPARGAPRWVLPAAAVAGLLVVAGAGWAFLGGSEAPDTGGMPSATASEGSASSDPPTTVVEGSTQPTGDQGGGVSTVPPSGNDPPAGQARPPRTAAPEPVATADPPAPRQPATAAVALGIGATDARDVLFRQFEMQDVAEGSQGTNVHRAVLDTTQAVWNLPGLSPPDSALAAYIRGLSFRALGNRAEAVEWLDRAVRVEPDPGVRARYEQARDAARGTPR